MSGPVTRIRENVPQMLRDLPVWLLHDADKTPIYADGSNRRGTLDSAEDRARLVTFEEAAAALPQVTRASGLGFALGEVPGEEIHLAGLDFDGCYRDGELDERVMQILAAADSYAERSPSGIGLHIIGTGDIGTMKVNGAEIYSSGRYFTVTGNRINGAHVAEIREAAALARQLFGQATSPSDPRGSDGGVSADNDITEALKRTGLYLRDGGGGRHLIRCPWEARHSPNGDGSRQTSSSEAAYFAPGAVVRADRRAPAVFGKPRPPRRLGHLVIGSPDLPATVSLLTCGLGFKVSDTVPGVIAFLRCSTDHHNVAVVDSPVPLLQHYSWECDDVDHVGHTATALYRADTDRHTWGMGRHFAGSNFYWYLRDPSGSFLELYADLDQILDDEAWEATGRTAFTLEHVANAWGPNLPLEFVVPSDLGELQRAWAALP